MHVIGKICSVAGGGHANKSGAESTGAVLLFEPVDRLEASHAVADANALSARLCERFFVDAEQGLQIARTRCVEFVRLLWENGYSDPVSASFLWPEKILKYCAIESYNSLAAEGMEWKPRKTRAQALLEVGDLKAALLELDFWVTWPRPRETLWFLLFQLLNEDFALLWDQPSPCNAALPKEWSNKIVL